MKYSLLPTYTGLNLCNQVVYVFLDYSFIPISGYSFNAVELGKMRPLYSIAPADWAVYQLSNNLPKVPNRDIAVL